MILEFEINGLPRMTNTSRVHWTKKMKEASKWKHLAVAAAVQANGDWIKEPMQKAKLTLIRFSSVEPDFDGLVSSFKHVIDGLVEAGVIVNDKVSNIGQPSYKWTYAPPKKGKIKVRVEAE